MLRIEHALDLDALASLLGGKTVSKNMTPWRSQLKALSRAITFVENEPLLATRLLAHPLLQKKQEGDGESDTSEKTRVIGITGLPGVGKSSLVSLLVTALRSQEKSVAVFAIDPSSTTSGGAILGDRIRMQDHFDDPLVFIRSLGSRGVLGGLAYAARSAVRLATSLGFDYVVVETVGVGQSEADITDLADTTVLVLMPNSGDEIQLMKAGLLQLAQVYVVNKCDLGPTDRLVQEIEENASFAKGPEDWIPMVIKTSAKQQEGIVETARAIALHAEYEHNQTLGKSLKKERVKKEILHNIRMITELLHKPKVEALADAQIESILRGHTTAMAVAQALLASSNSSKAH